MKKDLKSVAELCFIKELITDIHPSGIISIVSDTFDLWEVLTFVLPYLKKEVLARNGKVVIRPDSGDPVDIICGDSASINENERKGVIQILWEIFGGTVNSKGYKELDPHIGCIYGDAITLERCTQINERLKAAGFASSNMVYGIGSFTYQYNTRDTFGFALKSTYCEMDNQPKFIFKDPVTDKGKVKKSQKGCVIVTQNEVGVISYTDEHSLKDASDISIGNLLSPIFKDGKRLGTRNHLSDIRALMGGI